MAEGAHLINKQFNTPIGLYSDQNIREVIARDSKLLANGAVGIDFQNPQGLSKPGNLQNSAVLRMLEEEDSRHRNGQYTGTKRVAWPPARSGSEEYVEQSAVQSQGGPQIPLQSPSRPAIAQPQQNNAPQPSAKNYHEPLSVITTSQQYTVPPQSPVQNASSGCFSNAPSRRWATVQSPNTQLEPLYHAPKQTTTQHDFNQLSSQDNSNVEIQQECFYTPQQARAVFETKIASPPIVPRQIKSPIQLVPDNINAQTIDSELNFCTPKQARAFFEPSTRIVNNSPPQSQGVSSSPQITSSELVSSRVVIIPVKKEYDPPISIVTKSPIVAVPKEHIIPVQRQASYEQKQPISNPNITSSPTHQFHQQRTAEVIVPIKVATSQVSTQQNNPVSNHQTPQQFYQPQARTVEPPPSIITLRPEAPVSQPPAPVYTSQPATATLKGGKNLRGDMKWPPENVRDRMSAEEADRIALAHGAACRPRRIEKDYSGFFAQHALNSTYPGYKTPPGTQFYEHQPMM